MTYGLQTSRLSSPHIQGPKHHRQKLHFLYCYWESGRRCVLAAGFTHFIPLWLSGPTPCLSPVHHEWKSWEFRGKKNTYWNHGSWLTHPEEKVDREQGSLEDIGGDNWEKLQQMFAARISRRMAHNWHSIVEILVLLQEFSTRQAPWFSRVEGEALIHRHEVLNCCWICRRSRRSREQPRADSHTIHSGSPLQ